LQVSEAHAQHAGVPAVARLVGQPHDVAMLVHPPGEPRAVQQQQVPVHRSLLWVARPTELSAVDAKTIGCAPA
jgi:hypothetical protein